MAATITKCCCGVRTVCLVLGLALLGLTLAPGLLTALRSAWERVLLETNGDRARKRMPDDVGPDTKIILYATSFFR